MSSGFYGIRSPSSSVTSFVLYGMRNLTASVVSSGFHGMRSVTASLMSSGICGIRSVTASAMSSGFDGIRSMIASASIAAMLSALLAVPASAQLLQFDAEPAVIAAPQPKHAKTAEITPIISWVDTTIPAKGYLLCVHGLGLHKGTYRQFGERMAKLGWGVYACDIRGFGSFQQLGINNTVDFEGCLQDVRSALDMVRAQSNNKPVFLVGESMGGAIALRVASMYPQLIDGLISSVPAGERYHQGADSLKVGLKLLTGNKSMDVKKIVVDRSTDNEELKHEWLKDSLARFNLAPTELMKFQKFMSENHKAAKQITKTPVLMIQGQQDKLVKHEGNEHLIHEIPCPDAALVFVDGAEHLILEEGQFNDTVIDTLTTWLTSHTKPQ